jgi:hypothetical protein
MIAREPSPKRLSSPDHPSLTIESGQGIDSPPKTTRRILDLGFWLRHLSKVPTRARTEAHTSHPRVVPEAGPAATDAAALGKTA